MNISLAAREPHGQICAECSVRQSSICAVLDASELRQLEQLGRHVHFASDETVFAQEALMTSVYNVLKGVLRLYMLLPDGRRQIVGFALPGDFLGAATGLHHGFSADAIGPVSVCKLPGTSFTRFIENRPHLLRRINDRAALELGQARDHMVLLGRRSAEERVACFLIGWRNRLAQPGVALSTVALPMSRRDIADFLGLTIETVSRTFTKLERDGVIAILPGAIRLVDAGRAEALAAA